MCYIQSSSQYILGQLIQKKEVRCCGDACLLTENAEKGWETEIQYSDFIQSFLNKYALRREH